MSEKTVGGVPTIDTLKKALREDRAGFIKGLIAAGYVDTVVFTNSGSDDELVRLAVQIYSDIDDAFDKRALESWNYILAKNGGEK